MGGDRIRVMSDSIQMLRRQHLEQLRKEGNPFPNDFKRDHLSQQLVDLYSEKSREELDSLAVQIKIAGRLMLHRRMGKASFFTIQDMSGRMQIYAGKNTLGDVDFKKTDALDIGDIIACQGTVFKTKTGELTIRANLIRLLTKSLHPLPDKFHGLMDVDTRYRQRYVSLMVNQEEQNIFHCRAKTIWYLRAYFQKNGYLEAETPVLQSIPGGATARPFKTHYNALDDNFYLRIAQELYIKRLLVAGFDKVFELSKNFRNEGTSPRHNPEFTMLEFNAAYQNYEDFIQLTEELLNGLVVEITGSETIHYQGTDISFKRPFARVSPVQAVQQHKPEWSLAELDDKNFLIKMLVTNDTTQDISHLSIGELQLLLFEKYAEHHLIQPTFLIDYPAESSPLARRRDGCDTIADRFELFIAGRELVNGFSELNDPDLQAEIFKKQAKQQADGNEEAMFYDDDYINALEYGLPPNAGAGIGIDRLVMLLTNQASIRDVILFPQLKSKK